MITLFGMSSPNVRKIVIALEEMGLAYQVRHVSVFRGRQFDDDFLAISPMAKVPVLVDEGGPIGPEPIFESGAILLYLAETYGRQFLPLDGADRYRVLKWLFLQVANVGPALGNHGHFRHTHEENPYAAARFRRMAAQVYRAIEKRLAEVPYLAGADYTIADMATYPWMRYFRRHGMRSDEGPTLLGWVERISERPAVLKADVVVAEMGEADKKDRAEATPEEAGRFIGLHLPAPSAEDAAMRLDSLHPDRRA